MWGDLWLPNDKNPYIQIPPVEHLLNAKASSLKNIENNGWDEDILSDMVEEHDMKQIKLVHISRKGREDNWLLRFEAKGNYTVKSGYKVYPSYRHAEEP